MYINTRDDLIKWLESNAPRPCIKRALVNGTNENLGGFHIIAKQNIHGWIVKVKGKKQEWIVAVIAVGFEDKYKAITLEEVPWKYWEGDHSKNSLYQGDYPNIYRSIRDENM